MWQMRHLPILNEYLQNRGGVGMNGYLTLSYLDYLCQQIQNSYQKKKRDFEALLWRSWEYKKFVARVDLAKKLSGVFKFLVIGGSEFYHFAFKLPLLPLPKFFSVPEWIQVNFTNLDLSEKPLGVFKCLVFGGSEFYNLALKLLPKILEHQPKAIGDSPPEIPDNATLTQPHYQELLNSAINPQIAAMNFRSLGGSAAVEYLAVNIEAERRNDGRLRDGDMRRYSHLSDGGWWCSGVDILTGEDSQWGSLKPDTPRVDRERGRVIKYEHPYNTPTEAFFLKVTPEIWRKIAMRYNIFLPSGWETLPPSAFWQWVIGNNLPIILCEGAKKTASLISQGYVAVGLPGIWGAYRNPRDEAGDSLGQFLIPQLKPFATPGRKIFFGFDQDEKRKTIRECNHAIAKTAKLFKAEDCETLVLSWDKTLGKGIDDVIFNGHDFNEIYQKSFSLSDWEVTQLTKLFREPNLRLDQRYLGDILLPKNPIVAIKSPKNTGKTYLFQNWTELAIKAGERRVLIITHRINLGTQLADKLGVPYLSEVSGTPEGSHFGLALCIDSLHPNSQAKFNFEDWAGAYVVLDETVQLIQHLLNSSTCRKERVRIIKTFRSLLRFVIKTGGKILCADADLNDVALNFIQNLAGVQSDDIYLIDNEYKFHKPWNIYSFGGTNPAELIQVLDTQLAEGKKILLCLSGQKVKSKFGSQILESWFTEKYSHLRILRIDSESVADKNHPAFGCIGRLNEIVKDYDLVLATPTIETGVSIDAEHFDSVFGIFQGVQAADSVRQFLSRYRPTVDRFIWVRETGINRVGSGSASIKSLLSGEYGKDRANIKRLTMVYAEYANGEDFDNIYLNTWAALAAIHNQGMWNYRQQVLEGLRAEGHKIINVENEDNEAELKKLIQDIKNHCDRKYLIYRVRVSEAESVTDEHFQQLEKQNSKTEKERVQYHKGRLERFYNIPITPDIVLKDDKRWGQQITNDYYFSTGRDFLTERENNILRNALENGDGSYFQPDTNKSLIANRIEVLDQLKINELLKLDEVSNLHPAMIKFDEKCTELQYLIKRDLGIDLTKTKSPIQKYQRVINLIGYKIPRLRREGTRGNQFWVYGAASHNFERDEKGKILVTEGKAIPILDERERVFIQWLARDQSAREKALAAVASPVVEQAPITSSVEMPPGEFVPSASEPQPQEVIALPQPLEPEPTGWKGAIFRLKSVVSGLDDFTQRAYNRIRSQVDGLLGTGDTEPYTNTNNGNVLTVWVNFVGVGALAVPCEWLELST